MFMFVCGTYHHWRRQDVEIWWQSKVFRGGVWWGCGARLHKLNYNIKLTLLKICSFTFILLFERL